MDNLILFINEFTSYLLLFLLIVVLVIISFVCGVKLRKVRDGRKEELSDVESAEVSQKTEQ